MTIPNKKMSKIGYSSYTKSCTFWRFTIVIALCLISTYLVMILQQSHHEIVLTETNKQSIVASTNTSLLVTPHVTNRDKFN
jgi:hypothetical protein